MRKLNIKLLMFAFLAIVFASSCEQSYDKTYSWAYPVAGDWAVNAYLDGENIAGPFEIKSYTASSGQDSIWFDDYATTSSNGHFWSVKYKVAIDLSTKTFNTVKSINAISDYNIDIKVTEGKIVGNDSIYFKIEFGDDPGTIYEISGHRANKYDDYMQD